MSPRNQNNPTARENLIRSLAPSMMRAYKLTRKDAVHMLAALSTDERYLLHCVMSKARMMAINSAKGIANAD